MAEDRILILDHGYVQLRDYMGSDLSVVRAARQSFDESWRAGQNEGRDTALIRYLMKHRHMTPFEAVTFTFEIKAPIFVVRQWHRHRTWAYNEVSARYRELSEDYYIPDPDVIGVQAKRNKQARDTTQTLPDVDWCRSTLIVHADIAFSRYRALLNAGVPRELARMVLPLNTYTSFSGTVNLRNLLHFIGLRYDEHAQWEIQQYARALMDLARLVAPVSVAAWEAVPHEA